MADITPQKFIQKWTVAKLSEAAASQEHFIDLCRLLGQPTPAEHDADGSEYTFEKHVAVVGPASAGTRGQYGFCDVWWKGKFGWEYKRRGRYKDLSEAYRQLYQYREALENPPLLVVCDIETIEIHTSFTGKASTIHTISLADIAEPESLRLLRQVFTNPSAFEPDETPEAITEDVARTMSDVALRLRDEKGNDAHATAHFLMKCMFCMFAEDVGLLPNHVFTRTLETTRNDPSAFVRRVADLFGKMRSGGHYGVDTIPWFNGNLFDDSEPLKLGVAEIRLLHHAARKDWSQVEPAILGTLFERSLDPSKRSQIGAHYTSRADILLIVEPVVMAPLRSLWAEARTAIDRQILRRRRATTRATKRKARAEIDRILDGLMQHLASVRILDPACGSGNFLYVAIQRLLDLERDVITYAAGPEIQVGLLPTVRPTQLHGVELNAYAAELAQVSIWIGYLQWMHGNGFVVPPDPILEPLRTIVNADAIVDISDPANPCRPEWPEAEFIIGNPPFLGSKHFRKSGFHESYIQAMYSLYPIPGTSDLCCYWFEQAREALTKKPGVRVGLLATQGIRGIANRRVLDRIREVGGIFHAWSDRRWVLDGAMVHTSFVCFDDGTQRARVLDGEAVSSISSKLTSGVDVTRARQLPENRGLSFMGTTKGGSFDLDIVDAIRMLESPNPTPESNSAVIRPWVNGDDITGRGRGRCIIDFGCDMVREQAAQYAAPFAHAERTVKAERAENERESYRKRWWLFSEPRPDFRSRCPDSRYIGTPNLTKHRFFVFLPSEVVPDHQLIVFVRDDYYFFGVLQSAIHEVWARAQGSQLRERESGFRYTHGTCFETFSLPWPPGEEQSQSARYTAISEAAEDLDHQRTRWVEPPELTNPIELQIREQWGRSKVPAEARDWVVRALVRQQAANDERIAERTLTQLYNDRPRWLKGLHHALDIAVITAYQAIDPDGAWNTDWATLWAEHGVAPASDADIGLDARTQLAQVEQIVLADLLRLNASRQ